MRQTPVPRDPGRGEDPSGMPAGPGEHPWLGSPHWRLVPQSADWDEADLAARADDEYPGDPDEYADPDNAPPPGWDDAELEALIIEARQVTADQARAAEAAARSGRTAVLAALEAVSAGRRGPGMPGSAESFPGEYPSPAAPVPRSSPVSPLPHLPGASLHLSGDTPHRGHPDRQAGPVGER